MYDPSFLFHSYSHPEFGYLRHALALTALYVCAWQWNKGQSAVRLKECRLSYELCRLPTLPVVPDAHLAFEGQAGRRAIWLEVDGSSQGQAVWKKRLTERLTFIRSGGYKRTFGAARLRVCYVVVGQSAQAADTRRQTLCKWAVEAVKSLGLQESFAELFRFMSLDLDAVYELGLWDRPVWFCPNQPTEPIPLFPS